MPDAIAPILAHITSDSAATMVDLWPLLRLWLLAVVPLLLLGLLLQVVLQGLQQRFRAAPSPRAASPVVPPVPVLGAVLSSDAALLPAQVIPSGAKRPSLSAPPSPAPEGVIVELAVAPEAPEPALPAVEPETVLPGGFSVDRITVTPPPPLSRPSLFMRRKNYWEDYQQIYNHGLELVEQNQFAEAIANFNRAIDLQPEFALAWTAKGDALLKMGYPDAARHCFNQATELQSTEPVAALPTPTSPPIEASGVPDVAEVAPGYAALYSQGLALYETQQFEEALTALHQAIALQPHRPDALLALGTVLERLGRAEEAQASFDRAAALDPSD